MPIKTILVALTLEDDSEPVVGRALQLAGQHEAQLVGVHVVEVSHLGDPSLPAPIDTAAFAATVKARRTDQLHRLLETAGKPAIGHVEMGQPHDIIENLARSYRADIIVIGPGAPKGLREKVFGSTADRVVRCAPCPVLVVRKEADASYRHVAVGVDVSAHAQAAARAVSRLAPMAMCDFIHAFEISRGFEQAMHEAGTPQAEIERYRDIKAKTARRQIIKMFGENGRLQKGVRLRIIEADPATVLIRAANRPGMDLVALGTQGANAMAQRLLGSVARKVLLHAKCDVLVVASAAMAAVTA